MRVMARSTPQSCATDSLAAALLELLKMAVGAHYRRIGHSPDEERGIIREAPSRPVFATARPLSCDARRPGQMALRADAVAADGIELRRIHDIGACALTGGHLRDMSRSGSVAAL